MYRDRTVALHVKAFGDGDRLDPNSLDWTNGAGRVVDYSRTLSNCTFVVDVGGRGEQFARILERAGCANIVRVLWGNPTFLVKNKARFFNLFAQCSVHAAEAVKDGQMTFTREHETDLLDQGGRMPYLFDEKARFHIMTKEKMLEDLHLKSPDLWDTVCMGVLEGAHYIAAAAETSGVGNARQNAIVLWPRSWRRPWGGRRSTGLAP